MPLSVMRFVVRSKYTKLLRSTIYFIPLSVIAFLEMESSVKLATLAMCFRQLSPRLLFLISRTLRYFKFPILVSASALKELALSCNLLTFVRLLVMVVTPKSPILFSPRIRDLIFLKE